MPWRSERAFNLLMKLADDGITTLLKDDKAEQGDQALASVAQAPAKSRARREGAVRKAQCHGAKATIEADPDLARPACSRCS